MNLSPRDARLYRDYEAYCDQRRPRRGFTGDGFDDRAILGFILTGLAIRALALMPDVRFCRELLRARDFAVPAEIASSCSSSASATYARFFNSTRRSPSKTVSPR